MAAYIQGGVKKFRVVQECCPDCHQIQMMSCGEEHVMNLNGTV